MRCSLTMHRSLFSFNLFLIERLVVHVKRVETVGKLIQHFAHPACQIQSCIFSPTQLCAPLIGAVRVRYFHWGMGKLETIALIKTHPL